jgi:LPS-assembly protein
MKNKFLILYLLLIFNCLNSTYANEVFNFDVTEIEILDNGNTIKGNGRGTASTNDGISITADNFIHDKLKNILYANGNVIIFDSIKEINIFSEEITYFKNTETIITKVRSKATDKNTFIEGNYFEYKKKLNTLNAKGNVEINNKIEDYIIYTDEITYFKSQEKFITQGNTEAIIQSKYNFKSKNVIFLKNEMKLISSNKSVIDDGSNNLYKLDNFEYLLNEKLLKGKNILAITNYLKPKSDKIFFTNGIFNFQNKKFSSKNTKILLHKNLFDDERQPKDNANELEKKRIQYFKGKNDPRIYGVSSKGDTNQTIINKGVFTSCNKDDNCPPWSLKAKKITHDKVNKNIIYDNAVLNIYDFPVFYFPKFFHPDPSVDRRSGLLQPRLNKSNIVGSSLTIPYFHVLTENKDFTFKPTIFDDRIYMFQNEYRQENEKSTFIADFSYTKGYQSSLSNNRNGISHIFAKYNLDLDLDNFVNSNLDLFIEKVSMDTYLKIFENILVTDKTFEDDLKDHNTMTSGIKISLDKDNFNLTSGITSYENLQVTNVSDRYQYILPYYDFSSTLLSDQRGSLNFSSSGNNKLINTNNLKSVITNNFDYQSNNIYSKFGFVTNYGVFLKNLNTVAKNDLNYKSSPQSEILNINEFNVTYPLMRQENNNLDYLTPKISFRINPSNMKNYSTESRLITTDNLFSINRLGLSESYESGKSLTVGLDYRKENTENTDKYYEIKLGTIFRDTPEYKLPKSSTLQDKTSNIFGSIENNMLEFLNIDYNFSLDNDLKTFEHNDLKAELDFDNFKTEFNFHETNGKVGEANFYENKTEYNYDDNNSLIFKTRRNRKISLTEYYDFIYEYQNDCLTAAIKYRKTYYADRDATPKEDLFFSISLFPLATIEQKIDKKLYRDDNNDIIWK